MLNQKKWFAICETLKKNKSTHYMTLLTAKRQVASISNKTIYEVYSIANYFTKMDGYSVYKSI